MPVNPEAMKQAQEVNSAQAIWDAAFQAIQEVIVTLGNRTDEYTLQPQIDPKMVEMQRNDPQPRVFWFRGYGKNYGVIFMTSLRNRVQGTFAGITKPTTLKYAGKMIAESTHRLATDAEVIAFQEQQEQESERIQRMDWERQKEHGPGSWDIEKERRAAERVRNSPHRLKAAA